MDSERFDTLIRRFGTIRLTRGDALRGLAAAALGALALDAGDTEGKGRRHRGGKAGVRAQKAAKVTICHRTGSETNPVVEITVSENAVPAHLRHGDFLPAAENGCCVDGDCAEAPGVDQCNAGLCDEGTCRSRPTPGVPCDDGNPCTENDRCRVRRRGFCLGTPIVCPDGETCDPDSGACGCVGPGGQPNDTECVRSVACCSGCCRVGQGGDLPGICASPDQGNCLDP